MKNTTFFLGFFLIALSLTGGSCDRLNPFSQYFEVEEPAKMVPSETTMEATNDEKMNEVESEPQEKVEQENDYLTYAGAYFDIEYPDGYTLKETEESTSWTGKYDGASFTSPDGEIEFYIYSPLWGGTSEYEKTTENEEEVAEQKNVTGEGISQKEILLRTVEAKDGSYARSMRIISEQEGTVRYLFGIKYANPQALENSREDYNHFRSSLTQYADA